MITCIEISTQQGEIDQKQVKGTGIHYAILRSSFGSPDPSQVDNQFENNYKGTRVTGIPVGAYHYGYAVSEIGARHEARFFLDTIKASNTKIPSITTWRTMGTLCRQTLTNVNTAFCSEVEKLGIMWGLCPSQLAFLFYCIASPSLPFSVRRAFYY